MTQNDQNRLNNNKTTKRQKIKNAAWYTVAATVATILFILAIDKGLCDSETREFVTGPTDCQSDEKLIFDTEDNCYYSIPLNQAKQSFGEKSANALPNLYNLVVEPDEESQELVRRCYLAVDRSELCDYKRAYQNTDQPAKDVTPTGEESDDDELFKALREKKDIYNLDDKNIDNNHSRVKPRPVVNAPRFCSAVHKMDPRTALKVKPVLQTLKNKVIISCAKNIKTR